MFVMSCPCFITSCVRVHHELHMCSSRAAYVFITSCTNSARVCVDADVSFASFKCVQHEWQILLTASYNAYIFIPILPTRERASVRAFAFARACGARVCMRAKGRNARTRMQDLLAMEQIGGLNLSVT